MKTLYQILKVKKTSTTEEITKAYRKLSMKHHPDRGGNPDQFAELTKAYEVLSNPDRRRKYDESGETELFMDKSVHAMMACLAENVANLLKGCIEQGIDPKYLDVKRSLQDLVNSNRDDLRKAISQRKKQVSACDVIMKRWSSTSETDYMKEVVRQRKDHLMIEQAGMTEGLKVIEAVLKYIETCECSAEVLHHGWALPTTATSSSY